MRFYCIQHQQDVYTEANHVGRVTCREGDEWHHIGHNFPAERYWEHCLGCTAIWFYKQEDFPRETCPACKRELTLSHLCHKCETLGYRLTSVYAPDTPAAVEDVSCGSCGAELGGARWHYCLSLGQPYLTARDGCPYCSAGFFPATPDDLSAGLATGGQYQRMRLASLGDDRPALVAPSSRNGRDALFSLLAGQRDAIVLPRAATREKVVQHARVFRRVFDWSADWAGDLIVERPAIFERDGNKWRLKEVGTLAGRVAENGAAAEGPTVDVASEPLPPVAAEPLPSVSAAPVAAGAAELPAPFVVDLPPALPAPAETGRENVAESSEGTRPTDARGVADQTVDEIISLSMETAAETHDFEVAPTRQEIIQIPGRSTGPDPYAQRLDVEVIRRLGIEVVQPRDDEDASHREVEAEAGHDDVRGVAEAFKDSHRHQHLAGHWLAVGAVIVIIGVVAIVASWGNNPPPPPPPTPTPTPLPTPIAPEGMKYFPPGSFTAGRNDGTEFERPAHTVTIARGFFLDITEVTCRQYEAYLATRPNVSAPAGWRGRRCPAGQEELPVTGVDWYGAKAYAESMSMRLPTEMEWEYAARWGNGFLYPWGNDWKSGAANADYGNEGQGAIAPADSNHQWATASGLLHMSGNVWEWTDSNFSAYDGRPLPQRLPDGGLVNIRGKVIRGGAWDSGPQYVTTTYRMGYAPRGEDYRNTGFRCAKDAPRQ